MRRVVVLVGLVILFITQDAEPALACSYGYVPPLTLEQVISQPVLVRATVIEGSGGNNLLAVEHYLIGSGPRMLFVYRQSPEFWKLQRVRRYPTAGCIYAKDGFSTGITGYFALTWQDTGVYEIFTYIVREAVFPIEQGAVSYHTMIDPEGDVFDDKNYEQHTVTEGEFVALVAEMSGAEPSYPDMDAPPPRRKLLYITTESGQRYMLPVDGGVVVPGPEERCREDCPIYSPDGTHAAYVIDEDTFEFSYPFAFVDYQFELWEFIVNGQAVLFAPNSDFALVWDRDQLKIYAFFEYSLEMRGYRVWLGDLVTDGLFPAAALHGQAAWSEDSTAIAFVDAAGIWHFNFFQQTEPQLVVPFDEDVPVLDVLELSRGGRYLRYGAADDWTLLDVQTGAMHDNGLTSPDEVHLALIDPKEFSRSLDGSPRPDVMGCFLPVQRDCAAVIQTNDEFEVVYFAWRSATTLLVVYCEVGNRDECAVSFIDVDGVIPGAYFPHRFSSFAPAYDTDYDVQGDELALVSSDYTIQLRSYATYYSDIYGTFDLSDVLDSPIAGIEWGQSLWYAGE
jgi:hypothetical protein